MATYEVTVSRDTVNDAVTTSWNPSPTGNGTIASRYQFESGDIIKFKKNSSNDGTVTVSPSNGFFTTNGNFNANLSFVSKTVASTQANYTLSYSIFYTTGGGGGGIDP